ncbi:hypothetical protein G8C92_22425 [Paenibacillus donghaensis]|uniref:S-layer homology domain-containing protein n=1 Tax=Paenibacillus donghaensis TaxID=414771 RepID=UPI001883C6E8|nr:S-layer homology domain-containing protein [Paenibacillus donghaensis]MBE9916778.1 hypothetical protein [Paenibacillus donghaensis]
MSNTSYPIKENSNVMKVQGGEQKVMKKILTVALSTAMAFSMFASVAFGDSAVTPQQKFDALAAKGIFNGYPDKQAHLERDMTRAEFAKVLTKLLGLKEVTDGTPSYKDKGYDQKMWAYSYIEAVTAAGIMEGQDKTKGIFNYNGKVTVQEMATVLTRALKLEVPEKVDNTASDWAKKDVQAAINKGLLSKDLNFQANATREQLVEAAYAIDQLKNLTVASYKVAENGKDIEFTLNTGEVVKVTLEKALEPNKETEVKFKNAAGQEITAKVTWVVESATKVVSAASTNLKEVEVTFDGKLDKASATDKDNYSIDKNSKGIKSVALLPDNKTVRILLDDTSKFVQGTTYKVLVKNVKASNGTVLSQSEQSFSSADNTLPTVTEVKALGNKAIKVTFSEPVVAPTSSNFQLDDKQFVGSVNLGNNLREVILKDYTGNISLGAHKLTTALVEDYAGLKSLAATNEFTVAEDKEGPVVNEISATLEKVTITFNEEIDPDSIKAESFYWLDGTTKKTGKATLVSADVVEVDFSKNRLPGYQTTLFIDVKDYSGNANAVKEHKITASVDLVQPHVVETSFGTNKAGELTVRFDKPVDAADRKYFTIKNKDGDVIAADSVYAIDSTYKVYNVRFYNTLKYGTYDLKIAGVQDRTALKNTMVEYNGTFVATDRLTQSLVGEVDANNATRRVTLNFGRKMDLATLQNPSSYYVTINGGKRAIPSEVKVNSMNEGQSVTLIFPEYIDGTRVTFPDTSFNVAGTVTEITVIGVKSPDGSDVISITKPIAVQPLKVKEAQQKDARTFKLTFNQVVAKTASGDYQVNGKYPSEVKIDNDTVTLKFDTDIPSKSSVQILAGNRIETYSGNTIGSQDVTTDNKLAPRINLKKDDQIPQVDRSIEIPFDTTLAKEYLGEKDLIAKAKDDLYIIPLGIDGQNRLDKVYYETSLKPGHDNILVVKFSNNYDGDYKVYVKDAYYIRNANDPSVKAANSDEFYTSKNSWSSNTNVTGSAIYTPTNDAVKASVAFNDLKFTAKQVGENKNEISIQVVADQNAPVVVDGYKITVKDDKVTNDQVVSAVSAIANLPYTAEVTNNNGAVAVQLATKPLADGKNASGGSVEITFNKPVKSATNLTVAGKEYDAKLSDNKEKVTFDVKTDVVVGKQFSIKVVTDNGREQTITGEIK